MQRFESWTRCVGVSHLVDVGAVDPGDAEERLDLVGEADARAAVRRDVDPRQALPPRVLGRFLRTTGNTDSMRGSCTELSCTSSHSIQNEDNSSST